MVAGKRKLLAVKADLKCRLINDLIAKQEKLAGSLFGKAAEFTFGKDDSVSIDDLVNGVAAFVRPYEAQA